MSMRERPQGTVFTVVRNDETDGMSEPLRYALDVVEHMGANGLTAVPVKPSMEMLLAGSRAGNVSVETVWSIYMAMLRAVD